MKELIQAIAGEDARKKKKGHNEDKGAVMYLKKLSGIQESSAEPKIFISEAKDIEKFYYALAEEFSDDPESLGKIKDIFRRTIYL